MTIKTVIDTIIKRITGEPLENTVDTVKAGDASQIVTGITTTFLATCEVIQQSIDLGNNLIITHEPVFYNHRDEVDWLAGNSVYEFKRQLIEKNKLVIWRCHDYIHRLQPDGIITGMQKELGWKKYAHPSIRDLYIIPKTSLSNLAHILKKKLNIQTVRVIGEPKMICQKVGFLAGAPGGKAQIKFMTSTNPDVLICGEIHEWETSEYIRDALYSGQKKSLIIIGHATSEESGMKYFVDWLHPLIAGVKIIHLPANNPFIFL